MATAKLKIGDKAGFGIDLAKPDDFDRTEYLLVSDWEGRCFYTPVPAIERRYLPESWASGLRWYVVEVERALRPPLGLKREQIAYAELSALSLPVIMPVGITKSRKYGDNGKRKRGSQYKPYLLLPGYLLVGMGRYDDAPDWEKRFNQITACKYVGGWVGGWVGARGVPTPLTEKCVTQLIRVFNSDHYDESGSAAALPDSVKLGDTVEVMTGPFEFETGQVSGFKTAGTGDNALVSGAIVDLQVFGRATPTHLPLDSIKLVR